MTPAKKGLYFEESLDTISLDNCHHEFIFKITPRKLKTIVFELKIIGRYEYEVRFKRRILHVPNRMQMVKIYCFCSFALDSARVKCDV